MDSKIRITICMGSSCFARGNNGLPKLVSEYIMNKGLQERVTFKGQHCTSNCSKGPIMLVEDNVLENVTLENFIEKLDAVLEKFI